MHDSVKLLVVAPITLLVTGFLAFTIIGPVTFAIANAITSGLIYIYESYAALGGLIYGGLYALLVITGMHHTFLAVDVQLIGSQGGTFLWPMLALSNIAQGSAALAMMLVLREQKMRGLAATSSVSAFLGVTEPAIFGVNIRYRYPFIFGMVGSAIGGVLLTMNNVQATSIGVGGVPGFLSIFPNKWGVFFIGMAIVLIVPFVLTVIFGRAKLRKQDRSTNAEAVTGSKTTAVSASNTAVSGEEAAAAERTRTNAQVGDEPVNTLEIMAPLTGTAVPLDQVPDPAFAEKQMGEGVAIEPSGNRVVAPFDAQVAHVIKSKHAVILEHASGLQILIHVGINTVSLKGEGFNMHVEAGEHVRAGQTLLEFDRNVIEAAGHPLITPIIIPDGQDMVDRVEVTTGDVTSNRNGILTVHLKG